MHGIKGKIGKLLTLNCAYSCMIILVREQQFFARHMAPEIKTTKTLQVTDTLKGNNIQTGGISTCVLSHLYPFGN